MPKEMNEEAVPRDVVDQLIPLLQTQAKISEPRSNDTTGTSSATSKEKLPAFKPEHHRPLYRVIHRNSPQVSYNGTQKGLYPRLDPVPSPYCGKCIEGYLTSHTNINNRTEKTPFISLTCDLDRAFTIAYKFQNQGELDIQILVVDACQLDEGTCYCAKELIQCCFIDKWGKPYEDARFYKPEYLVWGSIPCHSIVSTWKWEDIKSSSIFREDLRLIKDLTVLRGIKSLRRYLYNQFEQDVPQWDMTYRARVIMNLTRAVAGQWNSGYTSPGYAELVAIHTMIGWISGSIVTYFDPADAYTTKEQSVQDNDAETVLFMLYKMSTGWDSTQRITYTDEHVALTRRAHSGYREVMAEKHMSKCNGLNIIREDGNSKRVENSKFVKGACPVEQCPVYHPARPRPSKKVPWDED